LTRFRGHLNVWNGGVHDGGQSDPVHTGVQAADGRPGARRAHPGLIGEGVRTHSLEHLAVGNTLYISYSHQQRFNATPPAEFQMNRASFRFSSARGALHCKFLDQEPEWTAPMRRIESIDVAPYGLGSRVRTEQPKPRPVVWKRDWEARMASVNCRIRSSGAARGTYLFEPGCRACS
jgi:hypothetical protein